MHNLLQTDFFAKFMQSPLYSQYCLSVLTADSVRLEDMLYNESFQMGFMDFMAKVCDAKLGVVMFKEYTWVL